MKVALLHTSEAAEPPEDPVLAQLEEALGRAGHAARRVPVAGEVEEVAAALRDAAPELVVNVAESFGGKSALESNVAALLNLLGLRYTGSSPAGLLLAGDKTLAKEILSFHGIQTPRFASVFRGALEATQELSFPLIVKPPQEDASIGVTAKSVVRDIAELLERMDLVQREYRQPALLEQYVDGREFYVGVLGNADAAALPIIELDFSGFPEGKPRIASWEAKWGEDGSGAGAEYAGTKSVIAEGLDEALAARMREVAVEAFHALRLRDYGRIDLRVTEAGEIYVIEVNPNCYLERSGEFARAAQAAGLEYDALIARIVELAAARYAR
ncbi:MAG TPA: ATP-grasp domain-containing protein [Gemmatimonadaceae bacterium]|nr:ATP-grasp domain-containing protein [Gemmatimonadaceae bacterium]